MAVVVVRNHLFTWRYRHHPLPLEFRRRVCRRFPISSSSLSLFPKVYTVYSMDYILFSQNISLRKRDTTRIARVFAQLLPRLLWSFVPLGVMSFGRRVSRKRGSRSSRVARMGFVVYSSETLRVSSDSSWIFERNICERVDPNSNVTATNALPFSEIFYFKIT